MFLRSFLYASLFYSESCIPLDIAHYLTRMHENVKIGPLSIAKQPLKRTRSKRPAFKWHHLGGGAEREKNQVL